MDNAMNRCPGCRRMSTRVNEYENFREELKERRKNMKRELEKLEMDLDALEEVNIKSRNADRLYNSSVDEFGKALLKAEEAGSGPDNLEELEMKLENAALLYNSSVNEWEEMMLKVKADLEAKKRENLCPNYHAPLTFHRHDRPT